MKVKELTVSTKVKQELINITNELNNILKVMKVDEGIAVITTLHTTAGLTINENADTDVTKDISTFLNAQIPQNPKYKHSEGNTPAHIKTSLFGNTLTLIIENGELLLGVWQGVYLCEFDGPRLRKIKIKVIKG